MASPLCLLLSIPSIFAFESQDPVRSSSTWGSTVCLLACSFSPFLGLWGASVWDLGVFQISILFNKNYSTQGLEGQRLKSDDNKARRHNLDHSCHSVFLKLASSVQRFVNEIVESSRFFENIHKNWDQHSSCSGFGDFGIPFILGHSFPAFVTENHIQHVCIVPRSKIGD